MWQSLLRAKPPTLVLLGSYTVHVVLPFFHFSYPDYLNYIFFWSEGSFIQNVKLSQSSGFYFMKQIKELSCHVIRANPLKNCFPGCHFDFWRQNLTFHLLHMLIPKISFGGLGLCWKKWKTLLELRWSGKQNAVSHCMWVKGLSRNKTALFCYIKISIKKESSTMSHLHWVYSLIRNKT